MIRLSVIQLMYICLVDCHYINFSFTILHHCQCQQRLITFLLAGLEVEKRRTAMDACLVPFPPFPSSFPSMSQGPFPKSCSSQRLLQAKSDKDLVAKNLMKMSHFGICNDRSRHQIPAGLIIIAALSSA